MRKVLLAGLVALAVTSLTCRRDTRRAYARIAGKSSIVATPQGDVEYQCAGEGPAVLVIHGSGGGFDQGALIASAVLEERFHWIAPSRFGYLRSSCPTGATFEDQAHAYAHLLDSLRIERVAVVALSHGGPSALWFALRYPGRMTSLVLLSCGVTASATKDQEGANRKGDLLTTVFKHDALYWGVSKLMRRRLMALMGVDRAVVHALTSEQRMLVDRVIDGMNPVVPRYPGVAFDNRAALLDANISAIRAPTLIVHARDDRLQLYHNAEFAAANIPNSRLLSFDAGGHLLVAVEQRAVRSEVSRFIRAHGAPTP
jgi:2-hydroxy-6-oxonona-2,4-dienedioate hydrolase